MDKNVSVYTREGGNLDCGRVKWLGHSCFEIELANKTVLIDPWLDGNPKASMKASNIKKADVVCVTHDH